jgi:hypothetical protein
VSSVDPGALFDDIAAELVVRGASAGSLFGKRALKADGAAFACLKGDALAFRLGAGTLEHAEALALPGAELFDPSGRKRPFKDWVAVPFEQADRWPALAEVALTALVR